MMPEVLSSDGFTYTKAVPETAPSETAPPASME